MNQASEKRLRQLHPALAIAIRAAVSDLARRSLVFEVVQGLRTFAEQDALYAQGRTTPGQIVTQARGGESNHNYGLAADLCPFVDGRPDWNAAIAVWAALGAAADVHGLEWGGSWKKFLDKPHVQLPSMTVAECQRAYATGGLEAVWAKATARLSPEAPRRLKRAVKRRRKPTRKAGHRKSGQRKSGHRKAGSRKSTRRTPAHRKARRSRS